VRFLLVNRFFGGAQTPTGRMLQDVAERLLADGHEVVVLSTLGGYVRAAPELSASQLPGFDVRVVSQGRSLPKVVNWVWFLLHAILRVPFMRWDRCLLLTDPPFLVAAAPLARLLHGRSRRIFLWTMDLYPEALNAAGIVTSGSLLYRALRWLAAAGLGAVDGVVSLGPRQSLRLGQYRQWKDAASFTVVVPPWDHRPLPRPSDAVDRLQERLGWKGLRIALYAGNLGEGHTFEEFVAAARSLHTVGRKDWLFVFAVRGSRVAALREAAADLPNVKVMDYLPETETAALLWSATVHLISMIPGWEGIIVPSKLYGVLQTDAPTLFVGPEDADTAYELGKLERGRSLLAGSDGARVSATLDQMAASRRKPESPADDPCIDRVAAFLCAV